MLFTGLIEECHPQEPFLQVFWAREAHLGAALEKMRAAAFDNGFTRPVWREGDPFTEAHLSRVVADIAPSSDGDVFWADLREPCPVGASGMELPHGVIASCRTGARDAAEIQIGFRREESSDPDGPLSRLEVNLPAGVLWPELAEMLAGFEPFEAFRYTIHAMGERSPEDVTWSTARLKTASAIDEHVAENLEDSLQSGFVSLTMQAEGGGVVELTEHKTIRFSSRDPEQADRFEVGLRARGYEALDPFLSLESGIRHWHFRPPGSRGATALAEHLAGLSFKRS